MMRTRLAAALLALTFAVPAFAQPVSDPATLAAAREFMKASDFQGQLKAVGPTMARAMGEQIRQTFKDKEMPEELNLQLTAAIQTQVASMDSLFTPALVDKLAAIYARHFSVDELGRLTAMLKDPLMVRFRQAMPGLMAEVTPAIFEAAKPQQDLFQKHIKQIVDEWIARNPQDKAKLRSPTSS